MKNKYRLVGVIVFVLLILDQVTKYLVETRIRLYEVITIIPGFFNLTHVRNKGAAFSLLATTPDAFRALFFITVTLIAVVVLGLLLRKTKQGNLVWAFSLIMAGALGNAIDRVRYGEVIDFIQWYYASFYWPSFNVADSAITIGVGLLAIDMIFGKEKTASAK
ncbi:MAG: signal peptidase II [Nitrospirota bacterium]